MLKRTIDILAATFGIIALSPILFPLLFLIWRQDRHSPFYVAYRVGKNGVLFRMYKLRSMVINADQTGVSSTSNNDKRITPLGGFIRRYKLDEIPQLINVLKGEMSLVGPRPNVKNETDLYTQIEKQLLTVTPGITDFASLVFSDEGEILKESANPDLDYNQLIRPWKSRLSLAYIEKRSLPIDIAIIALTILACFSRRDALFLLERLLTKLALDSQIIQIAKRTKTLTPYPPPGSNHVFGTSK
jgi:lipopolysaccharide/colanic/teichoic acid biosynthesis glycosyltransferase